MQWSYTQGITQRESSMEMIEVIKNFGPVRRGSFDRGSQNGSQDRRQNFEGNPRGIGRRVYNHKQNKNFH